MFQKLQNNPSLDGICMVWDICPSGEASAEVRIYSVDGTLFLQENQLEGHEFMINPAYLRREFVLCY